LIEIPIDMQIFLTVGFVKWLLQLKDGTGRGKIMERIDRLAQGNPGDSRSVGAGVLELRIDFGPGYRVYYWRRGEASVILIGGGDKSTQDKDILKAKVFVEQLKSE
jgi:putative addiction module killer protein